MDSTNVDWAALEAAAVAAMKNAYAPYSKFRVGAALRFADGTIVTGANVENASYGLSLCAETIAVASVVTSAQNRPARKLRVYCYTGTSASGFVDQKLKDRQDSLKDLREAIVKKKDWLELAESQDDADIVVEVTDRLVVATGAVDTRTTSNISKDGKTVTSNTKSTPLTNYTLKTVMRVGDYQAPVNGEVSSEYIFGVWRAAAGNVASQVERWAKDNHARITSRTPGRPGASAPVLTGGAAPSTAAPGAVNPLRLAAIEWLNAPSIAAAEKHLPATAVSQLQAARKNARGMQAQTLRLFEGIVAYGVVQRDMGNASLNFDFEEDAVLGDRGFVTLSVRDGSKVSYRGTIELVREGTTWKIAAVDLGRADVRFPRFDAPDLVSRLSDYIADQLRQEK